MQGEGRRYRVMHVLGRGGFGTVYRAEMLGGGGFTKPVALKILNPEVANVEDVAGRLRDEARLLGLLRHRAIVQVDSLVLLDGHWTVVMEYVEGIDLRKLVSRGGPIPTGAALEITQEVASALHAAYDRPAPGGGSLYALHRDIKPSNIQITRAGEVKVLDFGVARAEFDTREAHTRSLVFGSTGYIAPERLFGIDSHAGDVYSLGVVLYESLAGAHLGSLNRESGGFSAQVAAALAPIRQATQSDELADLLADCLSFESEARPPARDVERRIRAMRPRFGEPWLADWADEAISGFTPEVCDGLLSGRILTERLPLSSSVRENFPFAPPDSPTTGTPRSSLGFLGSPPLRGNGPVASAPPTSSPEEPTELWPVSAPPDLPSLLDVDTVPSPTPLSLPEASAPDTRWTPAGPLLDRPRRSRRFHFLLAGIGVVAAMGATMAAAVELGLVPSRRPPTDAPSSPVAQPLQPVSGIGDAAAPAPVDTDDRQRSSATSPPAPAPAGPRAFTPRTSRPHDTPPTGSPAAQPVGAPSADPVPVARPQSLKGHLTTIGDPATVVLHGAAGDFPPGELPVGTYAATVVFPAGDESSLRSIQVFQDHTTVLTCKALFARCTITTP
jgi:serine/threonine protein kinase